MSCSYKFILRSGVGSYRELEYFQRLIAAYTSLNKQPFWFSFDTFDYENHVLIGQFGKGCSYEVFVQAMRVVDWLNTDSTQLWVYNDHTGGVRFEEVDWQNHQPCEQLDFQFCCHDKCGDGCPSSKEPSPHLREWMRCKDYDLRRGVE